MNIEVAERLIKLRKEKGLSQEELAEKLGLSRQAISKWERGESSPDMENIVQLTKIYDLSFDELLSTSEYKVDIDTVKKEKEVVIKYVEVVKKEYFNWWSLIAVVVALFCPIVGVALIPAIIGLVKAESHKGKGRVLAGIAIFITIWNFFVYLFDRII